MVVDVASEVAIIGTAVVRVIDCRSVVVVESVDTVVVAIILLNLAVVAAVVAVVPDVEATTINLRSTVRPVFICNKSLF